VTARERLAAALCGSGVAPHLLGTRGQQAIELMDDFAADIRTAAFEDAADFFDHYAGVLRGFDDEKSAQQAADSESSARAMRILGRYPAANPTAPTQGPTG
jgi:hypothetical protein